MRFRLSRLCCSACEVVSRSASLARCPPLTRSPFPLSSVDHHSFFSWFPTILGFTDMTRGGFLGLTNSGLHIGVLPPGRGSGWTRSRQWNDATRAPAAKRWPPSPHATVSYRELRVCVCLKTHPPLHTALACTLDPHLLHHPQASRHASCAVGAHSATSRAWTSRRSEWRASSDTHRTRSRTSRS